MRRLGLRPQPCSRPSACRQEREGLGAFLASLGLPSASPPGAAVKGLDRQTGFPPNICWEHLGAWWAAVKRGRAPLAGLR